MKKKLSRDNDINIFSFSTKQACQICNWYNNTQKRYSLFQKNYELISSTLNSQKHRQSCLSIMNVLVQKEPSKQLITFQQIQKNLVNQQYLSRFFVIEKVKQKIKKLISKQSSNIKSNYMDFKVKNYFILNKYKVTQIRNLPYPLCKFQKQSDSKMSSTKSIQNKVLHDLQKQFISNQNQQKQYQLLKFNKNNGKDYRNNKIKINENKTKKVKSQKFLIKKLILNIQDMMQDIKDNRALQKFKKQMQMKSKFNGSIKPTQKKQPNTQNKKPDNIKSFNKQFGQTNKKQKQFKIKLQNDMVKLFSESKDKNSMRKKQQTSQDKDIYGIAIRKIKSKQKANQNLHDMLNNKGQSNKNNFRLKTNPDPQFQEYGLSVIREKGKRSKGKQTKNKSKQKLTKSKQTSRKSKQSSSSKNLLSKSKRLQTQYSNLSTQRMNTVHSLLAKSKSSSRIPTEYDSTVIIKDKKQKSKSKHEKNSVYPAFHKKSLSKLYDTGKDEELTTNKNKKSGKSKQKLLYFHFKSPNKFLNSNK